MKKLPAWGAHLLPRVLIYVCALTTVILCLQISFPLPRAELQIGGPAFIIPPQAIDAELGEPSSGGEQVTSTPVTYMFQVEDLSAPLAALVEMTAPSATLFLNGQAIQTIPGHRSVGAAPSSIFVLVQLPSALTHIGANKIDFELKKIGPQDRTTIWRAFVGPYEEIQNSYAKLRFWTQMIPAINFAWRLLFAIMLLGIFFARRQELKYLLLALTLLAGTPLMLRLAGGTLFLPESMAGYVGIVTYWQAALIAMFGYSIYTGRLSKPVYLFLIGAAVLSILAILWPHTRIAVQSGPTFVLACIWSATAFSAVSIWKRGNIEDHVMFSNFITLAVITMIEFQNFLHNDASVRLFRVNISPLIILIALSVLLISRLIASLNAIDRFNIHLSSEWKRAQIELGEAFEREQARLQVTALQTERERLMRDLHDGVSGRIVSIMALCELKGGEHRDIGEALREVLQDLRLVVASLEDVGGDLQQVFLTFREQTDLPLRRLGVRLNCNVPELPPITDWMPSQSLQVYRILQECVSNASKHSGCQEIDLSVTMMTTAPAALVRVIVSDRGYGGALEREGRFGLHNMRNRAKALGGVLEIQSGPSGTRVLLEFPVKVASPRDVVDNIRAEQQRIDVASISAQ